MRILIIVHWDQTDINSILRLSAERGINVTVCNPSDGDTLPPADEFDAVICMGGKQTAVGAIEDYLHEEMRCLRAAVTEDKPVLGICLGSQLLARSLGGAVSLGATGLEAGYIDIDPAPGTEHASEVTGRFFSFHTDAFQLPPGATLLATSDRYPQAWSYGSALALQFHPEISLEGITRLLDIEGEKITRAGADVEAIRAEAQAHAPGALEATEVSIGRWLDRSLAARVDAQKSAFTTSAEPTSTPLPPAK